MSIIKEIEAFLLEREDVKNVSISIMPLGLSASI